MRLKNWSRVSSPWVLHFNSGSCNGYDIEFAAIDPCIACAERLVLVDKKSKRKWLWSNNELWRYAAEWYRKK